MKLLDSKQRKFMLCKEIVSGASLNLWSIIGLLSSLFATPSPVAKSSIHYQIIFDDSKDKDRRRVDSTPYVAIRPDVWIDLTHFTLRSKLKAYKIQLVQ